MSDESFLSGLIAKKETVNTQPTTIYCPKVIKRVLHTRTEITIYPNGQSYSTSQSWFEDKIYPQKEKEIKKDNLKKCVKEKEVKFI